MRIAAAWAVVWIASACLPALSADDFVNIDNLPHKTILLSKGSQARVIQWNDHWWRVVDTTILMTNDDFDPDVCFEAKFDMFVQPSKLKLLGVNASYTPNDSHPWASILLDDPKLKRRAMNDFKRLDNVWICGTLRRVEGGRGLDLLAVEVLKLAPDLQRYESRIAGFEKAGDYEGLLDMSRQIAKPALNNIPFVDFEKLASLSQRAADSGMTLKERSVRVDDADALYSLALEWKEHNRKGKYRDCLMKALSANPDHPQASGDAEQLGLRKYTDGKWRTVEDIKDLDEARARKEKQEREALAEAENRLRQEVQRAIAEREALLVKLQLELRTSDTGALQRAVDAAGESIQNSSDAGFSCALIPLLASMSSKTSVAMALGQAARSPLKEVRRHAMQALVWRGTQFEPDAFVLLSSALKIESDPPTAQAIITELAAALSKSTVSVLVDALSNREKLVHDECVDHLRVATGQTFNSDDDWRSWWQVNRETFKFQPR